MPTKIEKDSVTGRETTGHEWDGLRELNTPLPKWWLYTFLACIVFALGQMLLYPSVPYAANPCKQSRRPALPKSRPIPSCWRPR